MNSVKRLICWQSIVMIICLDINVKMISYPSAVSLATAVVDILRFNHYREANRAAETDLIEISDAWWRLVENLFRLSRYLFCRSVEEEKGKLSNKSCIISWSINSWKEDLVPWNDWFVILTIFRSFLITRVSSRGWLMRKWHVKKDSTEYLDCFWLTWLHTLIADEDIPDKILRAKETSIFLGTSIFLISFVCLFVCLVHTPSRSLIRACESYLWWFF